MLWATILFLAYFITFIIAYFHIFGHFGWGILVFPLLCFIGSYSILEIDHAADD
jgi:hypothetical protein